MLGIVFVSAFAFEMAYDSTMNKIWDKLNKGRQWKDIRHNLCEILESNNDPTVLSMMDTPMSTQELQLCQHLIELPRQHAYRYVKAARRDLLYNLFWSMAGGKPEYMRLFFPDGKLTPKGVSSLSEAQGAVEGAEYTEAARGKPCGHIFRAGEASYSCRTCSTDDTCCLCSKCFDATDHTGHMVKITISPGNSGCCDCGDVEAWKTPMFCTIHSERESDRDKGKGKEPSALPEDLVANIRMTISRVLDFICDVISCAPEQLRQPKTKESIERDERTSRLTSTYCGGDLDSPGEYALLLWNDEKHTVTDVQDQVARACSTTLDEGYNKAVETDSIGRSILKYDKSIETLLHCATILEHIKITVTIRSSRDTFREQMCGTMIEWLNDIAGCVVGNDPNILRLVVCEELLKVWRKGSPGTHAMAGKDGIEDEEKLDHEQLDPHTAFIFMQRARVMAETGNAIAVANFVETDDEDDEDDMEDNRTPSSGEEDDEGDEDDEDDVMMIDPRPDAGGDVDMSDWRQGAIGEALEEDEATMAGYPPPPPPPPPVPRRATRDRDLTPSDSDTAEPLIAPTVYAKTNLDVPRTPGLNKAEKVAPPKPGRYWVEAPAAYTEREHTHPFEDVFQRVRLDWLILFDLRMWKKVRNDLRSLYISTVVSVPEFKRILGLRFAALYTTLAQLYLIADREPDHSIINISLQMLTTPSITAEVVERGNFLTTLMAILYTFLTTRQVGHPWEVSSSAVLGFDTGSVTNRRMYHFYVDMKFLLSSPHVQERMRTEERYLLQFLDLVTLHQGICPNVRAIGEHVEYETDSWIGASLMTREINKLCRLLSDSFRSLPEEDSLYLSRAIRLVAKTVIINSIGAERARFTQSEIKDEVRFKTLSDFEFAGEATQYNVVKFVVEEQNISFHHALHYTLSWLIECGKHMSPQNLSSLLNFTAQDLKMKPRSMGRKTMPKRDYTPEDYLMAAFDYPLRVCTWLAQIKAVDRFGMEKWVKGFFEQTSAAQDETQHLDVVEDMVHLLIVMLSDRTCLIPADNDRETHLRAMRRDIIHVLCFRPMSFNEICNKLPDKFHEQDDFYLVLDEVATFKPPEGVSDVGTFELKPALIEEIDPYIAHYNKNQREESEAAYRKLMATRTGKPAEEIVYEPRLPPIPTGAFAGLAGFTGTGMFAQIIYYCLLYPLLAGKLTPKVPFTRVETFLQVVLHLILIAISEDKTDEKGSNEGNSFVYRALTTQARSSLMQDAPSSKTIVSLLEMMSSKEELKACHPKIQLILKRMKQKLPHHFDTAYLRLGIPVDRVDTASPASAHNAEEERERKKRAALDRQAKVMAQFQQQQKSFLENQGDIDWGDEELDDVEDVNPAEERKNFWKYPRGTCILCQEDTDDGRLYGTFALFTESKILRQTDFQDPDFVREASNTPINLDRSADDIRPFGLAHENRKLVEKVNSEGKTFLAEKQGIETVASYISIGGLRLGGENQIDAEFRRAMFGMAIAHNMDVMHLVRLCYLVEIVKVVYHASRNIPLSKWLEYTHKRDDQDPVMNNFANFCHVITVAGMNATNEVAETPEDLPNIGFDQRGLDSLAGLHSFVKKYALVFLRKATILLHVHSGVDFNSHISPAPEADELTRLTAALRLPSFDEMCTALTPLGAQYGWPARTEALVIGWIRHRALGPCASHDAPRDILPSSAQVSHPGIFELVGLPKNYDTLIEECAKRRCPTTGKDLADPIVCLMCGDIFCGQTMCCLLEYQEEGLNRPVVRIGGGQQHMLFKCQGNVGIFINIRKCAIIYLHRGSGSFSNAPYIDKWGETDVGLRHGRQLFLNQKRYDCMIRNMWLSHGIPSFISRKLEADINNGGWETI
ncbi:hypothetical protein DL767_007694 [Monosporascus sp. MG133]|nr:hypothetical protein DL767_007694 [Monosporascus sp. MG133]